MRNGIDDERRRKMTYRMRWRILSDCMWKGLWSRVQCDSALGHMSARRKTWPWMVADMLARMV